MVGAIQAVSLTFCHFRCYGTGLSSSERSTLVMGLLIRHLRRGWVFCLFAFETYKGVYEHRLFSKVLLLYSVNVFIVGFSFLILVNYPDEKSFIKIKFYVCINNDDTVQIEFCDALNMFTVYSNIQICIPHCSLKFMFSLLENYVKTYRPLKQRFTIMF